jgi:altronate hydrolase
MNAVVVSPDDNVAVALKDIPRGQQVEIVGISPVIAREDVPMGHKVSIAVILRGQPVVKYGESILVAGEDIEPGRWVHVHNTIVAFQKVGAI